MKYSEWVQDKENRINHLEVNIPSITSSSFIGTMKEYEEALSNGQIEQGMLIVITKLG